MVRMAVENGHPPAAIRSCVSRYRWTMASIAVGPRYAGDAKRGGPVSLLTEFRRLFGTLAPLDCMADDFAGSLRYDFKWKRLGSRQPLPGVRNEDNCALVLSGLQLKNSILSEIALVRSAHAIGTKVFMNLRIPALDGVRGVALSMILVWHYYSLIVVAEPYSTLSQIRRATSLFWSGVDLFFVLSGFLIGGILLDNKDAANYFSVFYWRRVCRIFPLYYLMLATFLIGFSLGGDSFAPWLFANPLPIASYATFTQNMFMDSSGEIDFGPHWLAMTWSLAVEEQFYLVIPVAVWLLPRRHLAACLITGIVAAPLLRFLFPGAFAFVGTPWRADSLLSGVLLAMLVRSPEFMRLAKNNLPALMAAFGMLLMGAGVMTIYRDAFDPLDKFWVAGLYTTFILLAYLGTFRILEAAPLVWLGNVSYSAYLFHQPVNGLIHAAIGNGSPRIAAFGDGMLTVLSLTITMALAELSRRYLEAPLIAVGRKARYVRGEAGELPVAE